MANEWAVTETNGSFPKENSKITKPKMCFTHGMHTFADMTKRHYGKTDNNKQKPHCKIIIGNFGINDQGQEVCNHPTVVETTFHVILTNEYNITKTLLTQLLL